MYILVFTGTDKDGLVSQDVYVTATQEEASRKMGNQVYDVHDSLVKHGDFVDGTIEPTRAKIIMANGGTLNWHLFYRR